MERGKKSPPHFCGGLYYSKEMRKKKNYFNKLILAVLVKEPVCIR